MFVPALLSKGKFFARLPLCLFLVGSVTGQSAFPQSASRSDVLTIVNSREGDLPGERARVLLMMTSRVITEEFHQKPEDVDLKITLVLGDPNERFAIDDSGRVTLYLQHWDEAKFVDGVITATIQRMMPLKRRRRMLSEIRQRTDLIAPVSADRLRGSQPSFPARLSPDCISATKQTPCTFQNRLPLP